jgi:hypothetical protein
MDMHRHAKEGRKGREGKDGRMASYRKLSAVNGRKVLTLSERRTTCSGLGLRSRSLSAVGQKRGRGKTVPTQRRAIMWESNLPTRT